MTTLPENLVFVDVETTGSNPQSDRIIEIGIIRVENGQVVDKLDTLVNPNSHIPQFISNMTGITPNDVTNAPKFEEIRTKVLEMLADAVFVAHNANFDYSFIKHEFMRLDTTYNSKTLCTVRLARSLFPKMQKYNLDKLIKEFNLPVLDRHRAYSDAFSIWDFYQKINQNFEENLILNSVKSQLTSSIPENISQADIDNLPESAGVYIFYGGDSVLYVGKSKNIKTRVLSHFSEQKKSVREQAIAKELTHIETVPTHGELGALIRESNLVKDLSPIFNRRLRAKREMNVLFKETDENGYYKAVLKKVDYKNLDSHEVESILSIFNSKKQAKTRLTELAQKKNLCTKLLGLESGDGPCFNTQIEFCNGACTGDEMALKHNLRFIESFNKTAVPKWPFEGQIGIEETGYFGKEIHLVDKWCYLGSIVYDKDGNVKETFTEQNFDWDIYKLIKKYVKAQGGKVNILNLHSSEITF